MCLFCAIAASSEEKPASQPGITLAPHDQVYFIGDSTTSGATRPFGFVTLIQQAFDEQRPGDELSATSTGYWGAPSDALKEAVQRVEGLKERPTLVVIYFGLNDSKSGDNAESLKTYSQNLRNAVNGLKSLGIDSIICTPTVWRTMQQTVPYAKAARNVAAELEVPVIDLWAAFDRYIRSVATFKEGEFAHLYGMATTVDPTCDGVHLGAIGNRIVAEEFLRMAGMKPQWKKFPVTATIGNIDRNIGYPPSGKGTITLEPKQEFYQIGDKLTLTVEAAEGQVFHGWRGSVEGKTPSITYIVDGPAFIEAVVEAPREKK